MNLTGIDTTTINTGFGMAGCVEAASDGTTSGRREPSILIEKPSSSENLEQAKAAEQDAANEEEFIRQYTKLTGASESQARSV